MQKIKSLVLFTICGLTIFIPFKSFGKMIWEDLSPNQSFDFSEYNKILIALALPSTDVEKTFIALFRESLAKNGVLTIVHDMNQIMSTMEETRLTLHISCIVTENPNVNLLRVYATAGANASVNKEYFHAHVWEKMYAFENKNELTTDIVKAFEKEIPLFLTQYFETNPKAKGKAIFYLLSP